MKLSLIVIAILNLLEGIRVWIQQTPAIFMDISIGFPLHTLFHFVVGLFILYAFTGDRFRENRYVQISLGVTGLVLIGYGIVVLVTRQHAVKFGYTIHFLIHTAYYLLIGWFLLMIIYRSAGRQLADKQSRI